MVSLVSFTVMIFNNLHHKPRMIRLMSSKSNDSIVRFMSMVKLALKPNTLNVNFWTLKPVLVNTRMMLLLFNIKLNSLRAWRHRKLKLKEPNITPRRLVNSKKPLSIQLQLLLRTCQMSKYQVTTKILMICHFVVEHQPCRLQTEVLIKSTPTRCWVTHSILTVKSLIYLIQKLNSLRKIFQDNVIRTMTTVIWNNNCNGNLPGSNQKMFFQMSSKNSFWIKVWVRNSLMTITMRERNSLRTLLPFGERSVRLSWTTFHVSSLMKQIRFQFGTTSFLPPLCSRKEWILVLMKLLMRISIWNGFKVLLTRSFSDIY